MTKKPKRLLLIAVLLAGLMISVGITLSPMAHAAVTTNSQQAIGILGNVVGFDMNVYTASLVSDSNNAAHPVPTPPTTINLPATTTPISSLSQDDLIFNLTSAHSSARARVTFIEGSLNQMSLDNYVGSPSLNQPATNTLVMAQGFLQRYQSYTSNSFYGSLSSMINNVPPNTNMTEITGNIKLQVSIFGNQNEQDLVWTYVDNNGNPAPMKDVVLTYYNGYLESFLDNWQIYQTAGVPTLSSQDAITTALQATNSFSYTAENANGANYTVSGFKVATIFNATLKYINYAVQTPQQTTRGNNPYTLYPAWDIGVGFDQVYPGSVTGLNVWIWADTGNVSSIEPIIFNEAEADSNTSVSSSNGTTIQTETNQVSTIPTMLILLPIVAVSVSGMTTTVYLYSDKNKLASFKRFWKMSRSKRKITALCLAIVITGLIAMVPNVKAQSLKSELYVSDYTVPYPQENNPLIDGTYFQTMEYTYANEIASYVQTLYQDVGATSSDNAGSGTTYQTIYDNAMTDNYYYSPVVVFSFAPGGSPTQYDDDNGYAVTSTGIADSTAEASTSFVMMWTCNTAGYYVTSGSTTDYYYTQNFANAWTDTSANSLAWNGFQMPDSSGHCFIGFLGESPTISYESFYGYSQVAGYWIEWFYYYVICGDTVQQALNAASNEVFGVSYLSSPLPWYGTYWPGGNMGGVPIPATNNSPGAMEVYGDSNINIG